jgi:hypothetical protein
MTKLKSIAIFTEFGIHCNKSMLCHACGVLLIYLPTLIMAQLLTAVVLVARYHWTCGRFSQEVCWSNAKRTSSLEALSETGRIDTQ